VIAVNAEKVIKEICADVGIVIDGDEPWDLRVVDERFYARTLAEGALGLGESYMLGWWECDDLYGFFTRLLTSDRLDGHKYVGWRTALAFLQAELVNVQSVRQARQMADVHYNLSNELFEAMLGPTMAYSCGYWKEARDLDAAQRAKFDLVCRKLQFRPGERLLDIGCGWGGLACYAADNFGVEVVGVTISREQASYAESHADGRPVRIASCDYREFEPAAYGGSFDKIVSVGMIEHVGYRNYRTLMRAAASALKDEGLFLLHTIGSNKSTTSADSWIDKYIFPGGVLPSMRQLSGAAEGLLVLHDLHNIGVHYTPTLLAWHDNFLRYWSSDKRTVKRPEVWGSSETFYRMWRYYLLICAANFATGGSQVWQLVFAKSHLRDGYRSER
jgi:cyclopropane-fatty-acyl-phospholipid synthase